MEIFSEKNVIQKSWSAKKFSVPPKLGARSPPLSEDAIVTQSIVGDELATWRLERDLNTATLRTKGDEVTKEPPRPRQLTITEVPADTAVTRGRRPTAAYAESLESLQIGGLT